MVEIFNFRLLMKPKMPQAVSCPPNKAGFTLVEILISLLIFSFVITPIIFILSTNLSSAASVRNSYVASGLVQEGVEIVRNMRDTGWLAGTSFDDSIPDGTYRVQWNSDAFIPLGTNPSLLENGSTGIFGYDIGDIQTIFSRTVVISTVTSNVEKRIVVTVSWNEKGISKSVSAEEHLFNWR